MKSNKWIFDRESKTIVLEGLFRDVSDRKRAEDTVQKAHDEQERRVEERTAKPEEINEQREREITERKRTGRLLWDREEKYRSMMEAIKDSVYICSPDFSIVYMNPAMIKRTGRDATGELCYRAIYDINKECPWCMYEEVQEKETCCGIEIVSPKDGGSYLISSSPIYYEDGAISTMTICKDITRLKMIQDRLLRSDRLAVVGQLAGTIAHEINSPLQAVTLMLDMLKNEHEGDRELLENLDLLKGAFKSIRDTVKNLFDLNRPGKEEMQPTNINYLLRKTVDLVRSHLKKNKVTVNMDLSSSVPDMLASPQQLNHVFLNLINNAIEAMAGESKNGAHWRMRETGGEINIITDFRKNHVVVEIKDTGPGISEEDLNNIFDPFYTRKKKIGMGVGLSICHGFVEDHGGTIQAKNSPEGGAVFTITLPC